MKNSRWVAGLPFFILFLVLYMGFAQPRFFSGTNAVHLSRQAAIIMIFACAQFVPMLTGGLDLSQGGVIAIVSVVFALSADALGTPMGALLAVSVGLSAGLVSGALVAWLSLSPFVVTLGMFSILQGAALMLSGGQPVFKVPPDFGNLGWGAFWGVPYPAVLAAVVLLLLAVGLWRTTWGRAIYAVGSNERAARLSGISTAATKHLVYVLCALVTSVGALVLSSRIQSGHPTAAADTALRSIAACVIGGVSLFGGRGRILGVILGSLVLAVLSNSLNLLNISSYVQQVVIGITIIVAIVADRWKYKGT